MKRLSIVAVVVAIMFVASFMVVLGQEDYSEEFLYFYPDFSAKDTKLKAADCWLCHFHENGDTPRNLYGVQYEVLMDGDFPAFENDDVDADGYTNKQEIEAGYNPGDFMSNPKKKYSKCVSFILSNEDDGDARQYIIGNGEQVEIDAPCYISKKEKSMVPLRAGIENLGGEVGWDGNERRVDIKKSGKLVGQMWIGKQNAKVNGKDYDLVSAPEIVNSRTFVPVKAVGDSLGAELVWINHGKIANFRFK